MGGLSARKLKYVRTFASVWPDLEIVRRELHRLSSGVNVELLDVIREPKVRLWYAEQAFEHGWSTGKRWNAPCCHTSPGHFEKD